MRSFGLILLAGCAWLAGATIARGADLSDLSLAGEWYVLIHYKDARSEDKSITKFKDFAWSIRQEPTKLEIDEYPYVIFDEGSEEIRRAAMRGHKPWEPEGMVLDALRQHVDVSSRAMRSKQLEGSTKTGMKSPEPAASTGAATMSFVRNWDVTWSPAVVKISIVDSLVGRERGARRHGGGRGLRDQGAAVARRAARHLERGDRSGSLRMIRSKERRVLK